MNKLQSLEDTIVAISTASGYGGIGIVRLSGKRALAIADEMFRAKSKIKPSMCKTYTVHYGDIISNKKSDESGAVEEVIDEVLMIVMKSPKTYTREDIVEFNCHGGPVVLKTILMMAVDYGARLAEPGEFTKRAFLNGRIDLTQAEAVLDIIQSKTDAFLRVSTHQLKGELTLELESIREDLMSVYIELEAVINFPEDEIKEQIEKTADVKQDSIQKERIKSVNKVKNRISDLLMSGEQGKILKEGIKVVICGRPNVGKSSLLNILLKHPRAIVTDVEGTTRDTIEETAQIQGVPFHFIDTAGILNPRDLIEEEAVRRSRMYIEKSDLILFMLDVSKGVLEEDKELMDSIKDKNVIAVLNKCDLDNNIDVKQIKHFFSNNKVVQISALERINIDVLEKTLVDNVLHGNVVASHKVLVSNVRHIHSLKESLCSVRKAKELLLNNFSLEFVSEEIKKAVNDLDNITGRSIDTDLIDNIFSEFCIGK